MGYHTFPSDRAAGLNDPDRYRICSEEELLWLLDPTPDATVLDLGSGTGFFTSDVDPFVDRVLAVDIQQVMHDHHRDNGVGPATSLLTAAAETLPVATDTVDAVFSTVTYHEYATPDTLAEIKRVLVPGGRHVVVDWSKTGLDDTGPPLDERYSLTEAVDQHREAGFTITHQAERPRTFTLVATC